MTDQFNVTAAFDKATYVAGETVTAHISGNATATVTTQGQVGPLTIPVVAADGAQSTIQLPAVPATFTQQTPQAVTIDPSRAIVDTSPTPRTWALSADKLSITAVA